MHSVCSRQIFKSTFPHTPRSIFEQARFALEVNRVNFPVAWLEKKPEPTNRYTGTYESQGSGPMSFLSPYAAVQGNDQEMYCSPTGENFEHMHPKLKAALKEFHKKFQGRSMIHEIMTQAKIGWHDMPKLQATINKETGKDELCWNWLLGTCRFGSKCNFVRSHDYGRNLPERFVDEVIRVLTAGIDKMMDPNYSLQESYKQRGTYGNPRGDNKRQRR